MDDLVRSLKQEYRIILLLNHRNKNQHRAAGWYESFNEMKRNCGQIINLLSSSRLQTKRLRDVESVNLYRLLQRALFKQSKKWYWQFNGIIALGQFVTLGCTLVALLANIRALYMKLWEMNDTEFVRCGCYMKDLRKPKGETGVDNVEELGEIINEDIGNTVKENELMVMPLPLPVVENGNKKKKKKKKNKSAIDGIFG